ncbi:tyrosine-type recombinase/integrase [Sporosarcina highlanderae]|uniref:Tyrosine-type recombinase/integrase n=1 Tax=Sporosarcina highlanderae TaxID=3035916 RepID=A0ABT8JSS3_9BACL|nr:tyrosine-type recombinase/integrase [Sporosarcina highlanderae]MDN4607957.1 tyrosine-type recombinase/integrase [Sporosarcina highlanderae]
MAIKQKVNYDIESLFQELGHNYSDFLTFLNNNSSNHLVEPRSENYPLLFIIQEFSKTIDQETLINVKSKNTTNYYSSFLRRFREFIMEKHESLQMAELNEVIFHEFVEWTNTINGQNLKPGSINTYLTIVRKICTFAYEKDLASKNFNYKFKKIKLYTLPRYFTYQDLTLFFDELKHHPDAILWKTIFITFLGTGLRISELSNLKVHDVDFNEKLIHTIGKGNKERYITLYPQVERALLLYLKTVNIKNSRSEKGFLFSREVGPNRSKKISIRSIQDNYLKIAQKLNFDSRLTVHSFRHTFAVNCLRAGMQEGYLMQVLGHTNPASVTVYTQLSPKDLQSVVQDKFPIPFEKLIQQILS